MQNPEHYTDHEPAPDPLFGAPSHTEVEDVFLAQIEAYEAATARPGPVTDAIAVEQDEDGIEVPDSPAALESPVVAPVPHPERCEQAVSMEHSHFGIAERTHLHYGQVLAWRPAVGRWFVWSGTHWVRDGKRSPLASAMVRSTIRSITTVEAGCAERQSEAVQAAERGLAMAKEAGIDTTTFVAALNEKKAAARKTTETFGLKNSSGREPINGALAALEAMLAVEEEEWDAHPFLINFPNGTINLKHTDPATGAPILRPHDPADRITMRTAVAYVESARSDDLDALRRHFDSVTPGTFKAMLRWLGYSLTGAMDAKTFVNIFGPPDAGKSTFIDALYLAVGGGRVSSYAGTLSSEDLAVDTGGGSKPLPGIDAMRGKRLVIVSEAEHCHLASDLVKRITGGDPIRTRGLNADGGEWHPAMKSTLLGNGPTRMTIHDKGMLSRLWPMAVPSIKGPLDTSVKHRLEKTREGQEAVLRAVIRGAAAWYKAYKVEGQTAKTALAIPDSVEEHKRAYVETVNPLAEWIAAECRRKDESDLDNRGRATTSQMLKAYNHWAKQHGMKPFGPRDFGRNLDALGCTAASPTEYKTAEGRSIKGSFRVGIRLSGSVWREVEEGRRDGVR